MEKRDGRTEKKIERYKIVDGEELCYCSSEGIFRPCNEFLKCSTYYHGYDYRCRLCAKNKQKSLHGQSVDLEKQYRKILNEFYKKCGYDPKSTIPIHEQFLIRHEL